MPPIALGFGEMTPKELLKLLSKEFGYKPVRQNGSHIRLKAPDHPAITLAIHNKAFGPTVVRDILVKQVGLSIEEAKEVYARA